MDQQWSRLEFNMLHQSDQKYQKMSSVNTRKCSAGDSVPVFVPLYSSIPEISKIYFLYFWSLMKSNKFEM